MRCQINETSRKHHLKCSFLGLGGKKQKDPRKTLWKCSARIWRRYANTRLIVKVSRLLQEMMGMLSEHECCAAIQTSETASMRAASCRERAESSRSELAIVPFGLVDETNYDMMSAGQGYQQTRF